MGVGSEVFGAVLNGRRGLGIELKPSYYRQAVRNLQSIRPEDVLERDLFTEVGAPAEDMVPANAEA